MADFEAPTTETSSASASEAASTVVDTSTDTQSSGGGRPALSEPAPTPSGKTESVRDSLEAEAKKLSDVAEKADKDAQDEQKPKVEGDKAKEVDKNAPKEKAADEKTTKQDGDDPKSAENRAAQPDGEKGDEAGTERGKTADDNRQSEGRRNREPPARFLPKAKEQWNNVPVAVRQEVERMAREHETEIAQHKEANARYEAVRQYDEIARQNGGELKDSLAKIVEIETAIARNPIAGLNRILMEVGPRKADGQPISLYEVAQHIVQQGPQAYQQMMAQTNQAAMRQQPQAQQEQTQPVDLAEMERRIEQKMEIKTMISAFADKNPRYHELEGPIAFFLNSDMVPKSLSPIERLETAYDLAVRVNPSSNDRARSDVEDSGQSGSDSQESGKTRDNGTKSIKSAPGNVTELTEPESKKSIREVLEDEIRRSRRA